MKSVLEVLLPIAALLLYCFLLWRLILFVADYAAGTFWATKSGSLVIFVGASVSLIVISSLCDSIAKRRNSNQ